MTYKQFNEDTRVKIPATFQLLRLGYHYQSLIDSDTDFNTKIFVNRFKPALERINNTSYTDSDILLLLSEIHALIRNNDYGRSFYNRLIDTTAEIKLYFGRSGRANVVFSHERGKSEKIDFRFLEMNKREWRMLKEKEREAK